MPVVNINNINIEIVRKFLASEIWGVHVGLYVYGALIFIVLLIIFKIFKEKVLTCCMRLAEKTATSIDDVLVDDLMNISWLFYVAVAFYLALLMLDINNGLLKIIKVVVMLVAAFEVIRFLQKIISYMSDKVITSQKTKDKAIISLLSKIISFSLWFVAGILILANLGFDVSSLVAGLGIGGIAVALAVQNVLGDVFSSFSIFLDRPCNIGDYIQIGEHSGTVKNIGIKTTRIQTLQGEELVVANKDLSNCRLQNFGKMKQRRVALTIGVEYETATSKVAKIPKMLKDIVAKQKLAKFGRAHFKTFADCSLNIELVYFVNSKDYMDYMDVNQKINLGIKRAFEKEKIGFAYPTQTLYLHKNGNS